MKKKLGSINQSYIIFT